MLSGLAYFVSSCCKLLQLTVSCCGLFGCSVCFKLFEADFGCVRKFLVAQVGSVVQLVPSCVGQCEVANVPKGVFGSSCCWA